jgi:hypothetical protein
MTGRLTVERRIAELDAELVQDSIDLEHEAADLDTAPDVFGEHMRAHRQLESWRAALAAEMAA